jgi:hypothetical protein
MPRYARSEVLLHVSELAWERTENVADVVNRETLSKLNT